MVRYSFLVRLFHPLLHAGLSRRILDHLVCLIQHRLEFLVRSGDTELVPVSKWFAFLYSNFSNHADESQRSGKRFFMTIITSTACSDETSPPDRTCAW